MDLFLDTETTGMPRRGAADFTDAAAWPRLVSISWALYSDPNKLRTHRHFIVRPDGFSIPRGAIRIHGITTECARRAGRPLADVLGEFLADAESHGASRLVAHNLPFDRGTVLAELHRSGLPTMLERLAGCCTMRAATDYCRIPGSRGRYKWPTLEELHQRLFGTGVVSAHDAAADVLACARCYFRLRELGIV